MNIGDFMRETHVPQKKEHPTPARARQHSTQPKPQTAKHTEAKHISGKEKEIQRQFITLRAKIIELRRNKNEFKRNKNQRIYSLIKPILYDLSQYQQTEKQIQAIGIMEELLKNK